MKRLAAVVLAIAAATCARRNWQSVALPDLSRLDASVQAQVRERHDRLMHAIDDRSTPSESLAAAYGEYGMVLQAAEYFEAAEPAFLDAQTLSPDDPQWPYYLANLYKSRGDT